MPAPRLEGTVAVVTGAASGLGRATVRALAERGAEVVGLDLQTPEDSSMDVEFLAVDVTHRDQVEAAMASVTKRGRPLRVVVNCAGTAPARRLLGRAGVHDIASFRRIVAVNLTGTFHVLSAARRLMIGQLEGDDRHPDRVIVNTASVAALEGQMGQIAYATAKAGVVGLTARAARELRAHGIRVNAIAPGPFDTAMAASASPQVLARLTADVPFPSRLGRPAEYASLVLALVGNAAINGQTVRLDGALRLAPR